jgi:soluble lytic murein transglycosylase-like protein
MRWLLILVASAASAQTSASIHAQMESVARQREAVRAQRQAAAPVATLAADCEPVAETDPIIDAAANAQHLPPKLVRAVIAQESGFRPCAESKKGALGLMQLMPATAAELKVADPLDPASNVEAGTKYLRQLLERYKGDLPLALAAYNAGPATVDGAGGVPEVPETRGYVDAIVGLLGIKRIDLPSIPTPKPIGN